MFPLNVVSEGGNNALPHKPLAHFALHQTRCAMSTGSQIFECSLPIGAFACIGFAVSNEGTSPLRSPSLGSRLGVLTLSSVVALARKSLVRPAIFRAVCLTAGVAALLSVPAAAAPGNRASSEAQPRVQRVSVPAIYAPGSIVIVNGERKLYYITAKGEALRYGVAVGKNSELWMGRTFVAAKAVDPKWIPINGDDPVEGGDPGNPLGKRAMYLDWSLLRIHGTPSRGSIGSAVSNGCIRMLNEDVMDLFERVHLGAPVYAIKSWKDATRYETVKVAEKIYADPEAHRQAAEDLRQQLADRTEEQRQERRQQAAASGRQQSQPRQSTWSSGPSAFPPTWNQRNSLGR
jgi:hypothetical protein